MKLLFGGMLLALITTGRINCQLFPTPAQLQCLEDFVENNPENEDVVQVTARCPNVTDIVNMPGIACGGGIFCLIPLEAIYIMCGYNNLESCKSREYGHLM